MNEKEFGKRAQRLLEVQRQIKNLSTEVEELKDVLRQTLDDEHLSRWEDAQVKVWIQESAGRETVSVEDVRAAGLERLIKPGKPSRALRADWK